MCLKLFDTVDKFLNHQAVCKGLIEVPCEEQDITNVSSEEKMENISNSSPGEH